ncbi:hypothetical protein CC80DRAFT_562484 [Byssothecium circinans]|uniref:Transcription factor domain-containing protein n=1 Tax=Byssothecium circinans TaxID=147558 RepID=A0A6A5TVU9_9PLEO|nr:hypothetical protein CC80DRAFT_562484 [Byssothecium circinans]
MDIDEDVGEDVGSESSAPGNWMSLKTNPEEPIHSPVEGYQLSGGSTIEPQSAASEDISQISPFTKALPVREALEISRRDATLVQHYAQSLGRWLDGTDPSRQFTLRIPQEVKHCPILLYATLCFSARHLRDETIATQAYGSCISLLIERLNLNTATQDDDLLCGIVILRFYEQLNVPTASGSDSESHLLGSAALLRDFPKRYVDPTAPTLREAAFWVYVKQCLYNATIDQQPPNIDFSLQLHPEPSSLQDSHPLARLRLETAWANQMVWNCARVVNYCFDDGSERIPRFERWKKLWDLVELWGRERPASFDPIWEGRGSGKSAFPEIYFTADWHVISFGFYHFAKILLLIYKPGPKFAMRKVKEKRSEEDSQILTHGHAICGSCKNAPNTVPSLITLCHTLFIWGPLLSDRAEQAELLEILADFEKTQTWPTTWIMNALKKEWAVEGLP